MLDDSSKKKIKFKNIDFQRFVRTLLSTYLTAVAIEYAVYRRVCVFEVGDDVEAVLHVRSPPLDGVHSNVTLLQLPRRPRSLRPCDLTLRLRRHLVSKRSITSENTRVMILAGSSVNKYNFTN